MQQPYRPSECAVLLWTRKAQALGWICRSRVVVSRYYYISGVPTQQMWLFSVWQHGQKGVYERIDPVRYGNVCRVYVKSFLSSGLLLIKPLLVARPTLLQTRKQSLLRL